MVMTHAFEVEQLAAARMKEFHEEAARRSLAPRRGARARIARRIVRMGLPKL
jgi:hypothetical protein